MKVHYGRKTQKERKADQQQKREAGRIEKAASSQVMLGGGA